MGIGWIIQNQQGTTLSEFKGRTNTTPSSTRAELTAIASAISVINFNKTIEIITDSQCAIDSINNHSKRYHNIIPKKNKKNRYNNPNDLLTEIIVEMLSIKQIKWKLTKIKGHSGNPGNDRADELANIPPCELRRHIITANIKSLHQNRILLKWNNIDLNSPIKPIIKNIQKTKWDSKWRSLHRTNNWLNKNKANEIHWPLTLEILSPLKIISLKTDQLDNNKRSFRFKT